jgi:hypothetical protein
MFQGGTLFIAFEIIVIVIGLVWMGFGAQSLMYAMNEKPNPSVNIDPVRDAVGALITIAIGCSLVSFALLKDYRSARQRVNQVKISKT